MVEPRRCPLLRQHPRNCPLGTRLRPGRLRQHKGRTRGCWLPRWEAGVETEKNRDVGDNDPLQLLNFPRPHRFAFQSSVSAPFETAAARLPEARAGRGPWPGLGPGQR